MSTQLTSRYTKEQEVTHFIIKTLHDKGLGYRKIAKHLNSKNIKTFGGKKWDKQICLLCFENISR